MRLRSGWIAGDGRRWELMRGYCGKHFYTDEKNAQIVIALLKIYLDRYW